MHIFLIAILVVVKKQFIVILISISLMTNDVEHFLCACWPFVYFLWKNICSDHLPFLIMAFVFLMLSCKISLYTLDTGPLLDFWFVNVFSYSVRCLFTFFIVSLEAQNFKILIKSNLHIFSFVVYASGVISKNPLPNLRSKRFTSMFPSKRLIVLALIFSSVICFELIFVYGISSCSSTIY